MNSFVIYLLREVNMADKSRILKWVLFAFTVVFWVSLPS